MTEKELFCSVICASLFPQNHRMPEIPREQYGTLHEMLESHALTLLPAKVLRWEDIPEPLQTQWQKELYAQKRRFGKYLLEQNGLLHIFSGIPCVILKGTVSASYYPEPAFRAMGDIDLLVRPCDQGRAVQLLKDNGFREFGYRDETEQSFLKASTRLELHIGVSADGAFSDSINAFLLNHFDEIRSKEIYGFSFPSMSEMCNGLALLEHMRRHIRDDLGFRQVIDWMLYVDRHLDDGAWNATMGGLFGQCGLKTFAIVATAMCQRYFGLRTEGISWAQNADAALCDALFDHIDAMGNFGKKREANRKSAAAVLRDRSLPRVLMDLQKVGLDNWAFCHRHPWLKPFAWLYQFFLYIYRIITEGYNMSILLVIKERRRYRKTLELMNKLGL